MNVVTIRRFRIAAAVGWSLALASAALGVRAQTIPAGEAIHAVLASSDINSKNAHVGDGFIMRAVPPYPGGNPAFAAATIRGHVSDAVSAGQGRKPHLRLAFDALVFPNGQSAPLSGTVVSVQEKTENTTVRKALGAGAGMAVGSQTIGRIIGGAAGGVVGILGGAVAGFLFANNRKANVMVNKGANVAIQLTSPLTLPRRQAGQ